MNFREIEIMGPTDLGTTGTEIIDLDMSDILSVINLIWRTTVVTVSDMTAPHVACLSKIEIVDGSEVLWSLSGEEAQALAFYGHGVQPYNNISVVAADICESVIPIFFGRHALDPELAFDPKKYRNPQLKVTWDEDAAGASVVVNSFAARGLAFDDKAVSPRGYLSAKEIKSYTPVANTYEYTDLPLDAPYRLILMRSKSTDTEPLSVLNQFKLSEDHDKKVPLDLTGDEIFWMFCQKHGQILENVRLNETAADAMALYLTSTFGQRGNIDYDLDVIAANDDATQIAWTNNLVTIAATVSLVPYSLQQSGYCPHSCIYVPCGNIMDVDDMYDVTKLGSLRLTNQGGAAVGTSPSAQICVQQLKT